MDRLGIVAMLEQDLTAPQLHQMGRVQQPVAQFRRQGCEKPRLAGDLALRGGQFQANRNGPS